MAAVVLSVSDWKAQLKKLHSWWSHAPGPAAFGLATYAPRTPHSARRTPNVYTCRSSDCEARWPQE